MGDWTNTNAVGEKISKDWSDETRAAIVTDDGIITSNGPTGQTITLKTAVSDVDDYAVLFDWQEAYHPQDGEIRVVKGTSSFLIYNTGEGTGRKIYYRAVTVVGLS